MKNLISAIVVALFVFVFVAYARAADKDRLGDYPDTDGMYAEIYQLAEKYPNNVTIGEYGRSVENRPLLYIRIFKDNEKKRSEALVAGNIHGNEWIGNRMAMAIATRLLDGKDSDEWIKGMLDKMDFWILPCLNPDGYVRTYAERANDDVKWIEIRKNAHGVDLNRNFPLPAARTVNDEMAGSTDPNSVRYTGPFPYSESETVAIRDFVAGHSFFAAVDFHSNWGTIFPPKCNSDACEKQFKKMLAPATDRQVHVKYPVVAAWRVDSFSGEMEDALFYDFGVMAVCWEIFTQTAANDQQKLSENKHPFWSMNPRDINYWVENDRDAALAAIESAFQITHGSPVPESARKPKIR